MDYKLAKDFAMAAAADKAWKAFEKITSLLALRKTEVATVHDLAESVSVFPLHRRIVTDELYEASFESGKELVYVTIMSKHSLLKMPERIQRAEASGTILNVLTWDPNVGPQTIKAFGKHLGEEKTAGRQVRDAYSEWQKLAKQNPRVIKQAGAYLSSPTMQGVVVLDDWALVELIPYHTIPHDRPAIFLSATLDTRLFSLFQSTFRALLSDSIPL